MKTKNWIITLYKPITVSSEHERAFVIYVDGYNLRPDGFYEIFADVDNTDSMGLLSASNVCGIVKQTAA